MFTLTKEQIDIVETALDPDIPLIKISAAAGAAKSSTLYEIAKAMPTTSNNLLLCYNKAIEVEASIKFRGVATCKTTSAYAFAESVTKGTSMPGIKTGKRILNPNYNWRDVLGLTYTQYDEKLIVLDAMSKFFASEYLSMAEFFDANPNLLYTPLIQTVVKKNVKAMAGKTLACSFGFSLKYYHILLARGVIKPPVYQLLMIDEFQDSQPVVLEIFKLLPAHTKVAVGDNFQNISGSFLHTTNAFADIEEHGVTKQLTKSFRCSTEIAKKIEKFGKENLSPDFKFEGITYETEEDKSVGFLSKTNTALISKMVQLNNQEVIYKNIRDPRLIFKLVLALIYLKPDSVIHDSSLKYLVENAKEYYGNSSLQQRHTSLYSYLLYEHPKDKVLKGTISLISKLGGKNIKETYNQALAYYKDKKLKTNMYLATAYSSKGLSFGTAEISDDLNKAVLDVLATPKEDRTFEHREILMVAYVAASRARYHLINCKFL